VSRYIPAALIALNFVAVVAIAAAPWAWGK
jgi:hypothetical protein